MTRLVRFNSRSSLRPILSTQSRLNQQVSTLDREPARGGGFPGGAAARCLRGIPAVDGRTGARFFAVARAVLVLLVLGASGHALAAPTVVRQEPVAPIPGELVAWRDSSWVAVVPDSGGSEAIVLGTRLTGARSRYRLGARGRGRFVSLAADQRTLLAVEPDSLGRQFLLTAILPAPTPRRVDASADLRWRALVPVGDVEVRATWFADGRSFIYQDQLDDSLGVPSLFLYQSTAQKPRLFVRGAQRPLLAPTDDAIVYVGIDTTRRVTARDVESYYPVGLDDIEAGEFRWIAPLRSWIPLQDAWSADGQRVALVSYGSDKSGAPVRQLNVHSRPGQSTLVVPLPEDSGRPDRDHGSDRAAWSPDGRWIGLGRAYGRGGSAEDASWVWLVSPGGYSAQKLTPTEGTWRGGLIWVDAHHFVIADGGATSGAGRRHWLVEIDE